MIRDPLYREIFERLDGGVDAQMFERFAADVVRQDIPSAAPLIGGSDGGADGFALTNAGPPIPIITTTAKDVRGNLRRNLSRFKGEWPDPGRRAIFVTHQALSPTLQINLKKLAHDLGFSLQIYEREAVAQRLYHSPKWRSELLGIPGDLPALSQIPIRSGAWVEVKSVGRERDLSWLTSTPGDRLLHGMPASGKTFLLEAISRDHDAFFVTTNDASKIADAVRELRPSTLIVDDAHARPDVLDAVLAVRTQTGAAFSVVATSWTGFEAPVIEKLGVSNSAVRELRLLRRFEIAEVLEQIGITGPDWLVAYLLGQADGRVGLAVTLATRWRAGDGRDVVSGDAMARFVCARLEALVSLPLRGLLAAFSIGGAGGMPISSVAAAVGVDLLSLHNAVARIGSTGVIRTRRGIRPPERLTVVPEVLRGAMVRDVVFGPGPQLPLEHLLAMSPDPCELAGVLIEATRQGADVPSRLVRDALMECLNVDTWTRYAHLGPSEAQWVLDGHPECVTKSPRPFLRHIPAKAIRSLLESSIDDDRELHTHPGHGLRLLQDWVRSGTPGTGEPVRRRQVLCDVASEWAAEDSSCESVACRAMLIALDPRFEDTSLDPIEGRKFTMRSGLPATNELSQILELWPSVKSHLEKSDWMPWRGLLELFRSWVHVGGMRGILKDAEEVVMPGVRRMLDDLASLAADHPAVLRSLAETAQARGWNVEITDDEVFETLFPRLPGPRSEWDLQSTDQAARDLAARWSVGKPILALDEICRCSNERRLVEHIWPDMTGVVLSEIAASAPNTVEWLDGIVGCRMAPGSEQPFLEIAVRRRVSGWRERCEVLLGEHLYGPTSAMALLCCDDVPGDLLDAAIEAIADSPGLMSTACLRRQIPEGTLLKILRCESEELAVAAALNLWSADKGYADSPALRDAWRRAFYLASPNEWTVRDILTVHPDLAEPWLRKLGERGSARIFGVEHTTLPEALRLTPLAAWPEILKGLENVVFINDLVAATVGDDAELIQTILEIEELREVHLAPLRNPPGPGWATVVVAALRAGYTPVKIANVVLNPTISGWTGSEAAHWQETIDALPDPASVDGGVAEVIRICREEWENRRGRAIHEEDDEAIHGD